MAHNEEREEAKIEKDVFMFPPSQRENLPLEAENIEVQNIQEIEKSVTSTSTFGYFRRSIFVAAAMGLVFLGRCFHQEKLEDLHLKWRLSIDGEKMKMYFGPVTHFKSFTNVETIESLMSRMAPPMGSHTASEN